jgi:hypothetical protein
MGSGLFIGLGVAVALPALSPVLFTPDIHITPLQSTLLGVLIVAVAGSTSTGLYYLVPLRAIKVFSWTSGGASIVGVPVLVIFTGAWGATGALTAIASVEAGVFVAQASIVLVLLSKRGF